MAPVLWGLDLAEFKWNKFKSSYMWNNAYHLRRTKFIVYQIAMIFCVISESLGTAALSNYVDQQRDINKIGDPSIYELNNDYIGIASFNIFAGIYVAFIFGGAFFFDLIWPERREDLGVRIAWKICSVLTIFITLATAIAMTVIVAIHTATITGTAEQSAQIEAQLRAEGRYPLRYRNNGRAIASLVFLWPGFVACIASTIVMWLSINYTERNGPWSSHERLARGLGGKELEMRDQSIDGNTLNAQGQPAVHHDWHAEKLKDSKRGGGPTERPAEATTSTRMPGQ